MRREHRTPASQLSASSFPRHRPLSDSSRIHLRSDNSQHLPNHVSMNQQRQRTPNPAPRDMSNNNNRDRLRLSQERRTKGQGHLEIENINLYVDSDDELEGEILPGVRDRPKMKNPHEVSHLDARPSTLGDMHPSPVENPDSGTMATVDQTLSSLPPFPRALYMDASSTAVGVEGERSERASSGREVPRHGAHVVADDDHRGNTAHASVATTWSRWLQTKTHSAFSLAYQTLLHRNEPEAHPKYTNDPYGHVGENETTFPEQLTHPSETLFALVHRQPSMSDGSLPQPQLPSFFAGDAISILNTSRSSSVQTPLSNLGLTSSLPLKRQFLEAFVPTDKKAALRFTSEPGTDIATLPHATIDPPPFPSRGEADLKEGSIAPTTALHQALPHIRTVQGAVERFLERRDDESYQEVESIVLQSASNITPEDWNAAQGNTRLLLLFLESVRVDEGDAAMQELIQEAIDGIVLAHPSFALRGTYVPIVRALLRTPAARITEAQKQVLVRSGFQFEQIIEDYPHTLRMNPSHRVFSSSFMRERVGKDWVPYWATLGMLLIIGTFATLIALSVAVGTGIYAELLQDMHYWGVLGALLAGGNTVAFGVLWVIWRDKFISRRGKRYEDEFTQLPAFPPVYLKLIPLLYEIAIYGSFMFHGVWNAPPRQVPIVRDLAAMFGLCVVLHSVAVAVPLVLFEQYMLVWEWNTLSARAPLVYPLNITEQSSLSKQYTAFITVTSTSVVLTIVFLSFKCLFPRGRAVIFGFSVTARDRPAAVSRGSIKEARYARLFGLFLFYLFEYGVLLLITGAMRTTVCSTSTNVWLIGIGITSAVTLVCFGVAVYFEDEIIRALRWYVIPFGIQIAWFAVGHYFNFSREESVCVFLLTMRNFLLLWNYIAMGILTFLFVAFLVRYGIRRFQIMQETTTGVLRSESSGGERS